MDDESPAFFQLSGGAGQNCTDRPSADASTDDLVAVRGGFLAGCGLNRRIHTQPPAVLQWIRDRSAVPAGLLSGVLAPNFPADQLVIFANALQMRPGILSAIREKLAVPIPGGSKRTLLFIWAAGMIDGDGGSGVLDGVGPGRLLGMGLRRGPGELPHVTRLSDAVHGATAGAAAGRFGQVRTAQVQCGTVGLRRQGGKAVDIMHGSSSTSPLCGPPTNDTEVLGHFVTNSSPPLPSLMRAAGTNCHHLLRHSRTAGVAVRTAGRRGWGPSAGSRRGGHQYDCRGGGRGHPCALRPK